MVDLYNGKWWWAYLDDCGKIHIKKYTGDRIIQNTEQLPFCKGIFDPFTAINKIDAQRKIAKFLSEQQYYEKKAKS
jgi:hypothetical protein